MTREPVVISTPDPMWAERAAALITALHAALGARALRIDHIGSTSIPAMDAKDVLDIQVSVSDLDDAQRHFEVPLRGLGFARSPNGTRDHVPAGRSDDPKLWTKRFWARRGPGEDVNLHVRLSGSPNERLALLFRDWLRVHPQAVIAYSAIKRSLAAAMLDLDTYAEVKDPIVDLVIATAEEWAAETGWSPSSQPGSRRSQSTSVGRMQDTVIVITGPIASGKSTVARALFRELAALEVRAAVIDLDVIEDMLTADGPKSDLESWALARRAVARLANGFLQDGVAVVIADGSFNLAHDRTTLGQHLDTKADMLFVTLNVTLKEAIRRAQGDPTRGVARDPAFLAEYFAAALKTSAERPATDVVIDTESVSPTAAAAEIARIVGRGGRLE